MYYKLSRYRDSFGDITLIKPASKNLVELRSLFEIEHGNKFDLNKMQQCLPNEGSIAFIGRSGDGNGIVAFIEKVAGHVPYNSGLITVALGGSAVSSFVQPRPFYTAQNIDVLTPLVDMSLDVKLYYCLCIEANRFRYSTYGREANRTLKTLLVPQIEFIPAWVDGASKSVIQELGQNLKQAGR